MSMLYALSLLSSLASADEPLTARGTWSGNVRYTLAGGALAIDGSDSGTDVDQTRPLTFTTSAADVPAGTTLLAGWLYWAGNQTQSNSAAPCTSSAPDTSVTLTTPGGAARAVAADVCWCADGGAGSYDIWTCKLDLTATLTAEGALVGSWTVTDYAGQINNSSTANASAALLLVGSDAAAPRRRVTAFDGVETFSTSNATYHATGLNLPPSPHGTIAWWTLDGDVGGPNPSEFVQVKSQPAGIATKLSDAVNPIDNPMNSTINITSPAQTGTIGVDIDRIDISPYLVAGDTSLDATFSMRLAMSTVMSSLRPTMTSSVIGSTTACRATRPRTASTKLTATLSPW